MALIECVPNVSEGRRPDVIDALAAAVAGGRWRAPARSTRLTPRTIDRCSPSPAKPSRSAGRSSHLFDVCDPRASTCGSHRGAHPRHGRRRRCAVHPDRRRNDGLTAWRWRRATAADGRARASNCRFSCTRRPPRQIARGATSRTSGAASSKDSPEKMASPDWAPDLRSRPGPIQPQARR